MGILRIMLALAVVVDNTHKHLGIHWFGKTYLLQHILFGGTAVWIFFGISGFYMALIMKKYHLDQKISWHHIKNFYLSRIVRIYPLYYFAFLLILLTNNWFYTVGNLSGLSRILIIFSNLFIVGHDILWSFDISSASSTPILNGKTLDHHALFPIYQAWTLSQELFFYLLIPFIMRRGMLVVPLLMVLSFLYEYSDYQILDFYPSSILGHLFLFLLGSFLYVFVYEKIQKMNPNIVKIIAWISMAMYSILFVDYSILKPFIFNDKLIASFLIIIPIPFIFQYFKKKKWDSFIGLFSYPIYILHVPILALLGTKYLSWLWLPMRNSLPFFTAGAVFLIFIILICIPVVLFFEIPIDRLRHRLFSK